MLQKIYTGFKLISSSRLSRSYWKISGLNVGLGISKKSEDLKQNLYVDNLHGSSFGYRTSGQGNKIHFRKYSSPSKIGHDEVPNERWTKMCGCCGLHTQGDKELERYLNEELRDELEQDAYSQYRGIGLTSLLEPPDGFELISNPDSSAVVLSSRRGNEIVIVRANINDSLVDDSVTSDSDDSNSEQNTMVSRPRFFVELYKEGISTSLCISCAYLNAEDLYSCFVDNNPSHLSDSTRKIFHKADMSMIFHGLSWRNSFTLDQALLEIEEFAILVAGQKWNSEKFCVNCTRMNQRLYDALMDILIERGINSRFTLEFSRFCTTLECRQYLTFLERLRNFVCCKM